MGSHVGFGLKPTLAHEPAAQKMLLATKVVKMGHNDVIRFEGSQSSTDTVYHSLPKLIALVLGRVRRIANGAGVMEREVQELIKQYTKFAQVRVTSLTDNEITMIPSMDYVIRT